MTLARCAERTSRIGLGPGVLIPSLRHPMTAAASIAGLEALAPGRVVIGVGSGFTGRHCLGKRPLAWATVAKYVRTVQALLRGEQVEWDGRGHPDAPARGLRRAAARSNVQWVVGVQGPKGQAVAHEIGDGAFSLFPIEGFDWMVQLAFGTVLDDGEDPGSEHAIAAAGPAVAVLLHGSYEQGAPLDPNWAAGIEADRRAHPPSRGARPPPHRGDRTRPALHHRRSHHRVHLHGHAERRSARRSRRRPRRRHRDRVPARRPRHRARARARSPTRRAPRAEAVGSSRLDLEHRIAGRDRGDRPRRGRRDRHRRRTRRLPSSSARGSRAGSRPSRVSATSVGAEHLDPPADPQLAALRDPQVADPLRGAARRHEIAVAVEVERVHGNPLPLPRLATPHCELARAPDADTPAGQPGDDRVEARAG